MRVLITGANRGIGRAMLEAYGNQGTDVLGTSRSAVSGLLPLDVTDPASCAALSETLGDTALSLLVCNAGVFLDKGANLDRDYTPEIWAQTFAANVTGVFLTIQALRAQLRAAPAPKIAIISSQMGAHARATGGEYAYRASKAAVLNLGLNLAADLKSEGIAVGIYHPGWVQTDMGGGSAPVSPQASAQGLLDRFEALSLATTGCFETWDGHPHPR